MNEGGKKTIAILANFPAWLYTDKLPDYDNHYDVWLVALHESLARQNEFDVHWVTFSGHVRQPLRFESLGQRIHVLPRYKRLFGPFTLHALDRMKVARELARIKPDMVHSWGTEDCYGLCAADFHGAKLHSVQGAMRAYVKRAWFNYHVYLHSLYEPYVWRRISHITTESPWAADRVREVVPAAKPIHLEYAVEDRFFHIERNPSATPQCLYIGTYTNIKNVTFLIEAFADPRLSHVKLKLAGFPPGFAPKEIPPNVEVVGIVGREEVASLLSESWALVHMSLGDTGPTVVKEARVAGLPVILSDCCGSTQHVEEGKSGFILSPRNREGLVKAVLETTKDAETALRMGAHGRERCREALGKEKMIDTLLHLYHTILAEARPHEIS